MTSTCRIDSGKVRLSPGRLVKAGTVSAAISLFVFSLVFATQVLAVIANPEPVTLVQPDGMEITVVLKGDEFMHWNEDESGYLITRSADRKWWVYAREELGRIIPTEHIVGRADASSVGIKPDLSKMRSIAGQSPMLNTPGIERAAASGLTYNLVILVNFTDLTITNTTQEFNALFNQLGYTADGAAGSVKEYYLEISYGALDLVSIVVEPVTLSQGYAYYGGDLEYIRVREMVIEALEALDARGFDFRSVDGDGDGWIDGLTIIRAGGGQEDPTNDPDYIWSHYGALPSVRYYDGIGIYDYHTEPARRGWDSAPASWGITRIGIICHEMGHALGLPDLYDYDYDSRGVGEFCLMGYGCYNGDRGTSPAHMSAWCKVELGWVVPTLITGEGYYPISQVETNTEIYKLQGGFASNEYFLVENRQGVGFDAELPGRLKGLLIWHIDENQPDNDDQTHYLVDLEEASGTQDLERENPGNDADFDYFRAGNLDEFTGTTIPNNLSYDSVPLDLDISAVSETGASMSFLVNEALIPTGDDDIPVLSSYLRQNYPNPFNPNTRISFSIASGSPVSLRLYDVSGRLVKTLVDRRLDAGAYDENWNGTDESGTLAASGVYFYSLISKEFSETRKMILLR